MKFSMMKDIRAIQIANPSFILLSSFNFTIWRGRGGLDRMLVEFTTTHAISAYPTDIEGSNPAQAKCTTLCDKVTLSHNVLLLALIEIRTHNISGDGH
jgi:hypothetical protein